MGANVWLADPPESRWGRLNNVCRPETSTATTGSAGREAAVSRGSSRSVTQSVENSCGASDEGVVDLEACGGTVLLGANLNCEGQANELVDTTVVFNGRIAIAGAFIGLLLFFTIRRIWIVLVCCLLRC